MVSSCRNFATKADDSVFVGTASIHLLDSSYIYIYIYICNIRLCLLLVDPHQSSTHSEWIHWEYSPCSYRWRVNSLTGTVMEIKRKTIFQFTNQCDIRKPRWIGTLNNSGKQFPLLYSFRWVWDKLQLVGLDHSSSAEKKLSVRPREKVGQHKKRRQVCNWILNNNLILEWFWVRLAVFCADNGKPWTRCKSASKISNSYNNHLVKGRRGFFKSISHARCPYGSTYCPGGSLGYAINKMGWGYGWISKMEYLGGSNFLLQSIITRTLSSWIHESWHAQPTTKPLTARGHYQTPPRMSGLGNYYLWNVVLVLFLGPSPRKEGSLQRIIRCLYPQIISIPMHDKITTIDQPPSSRVCFVSPHNPELLKDPSNTARAWSMWDGWGVLDGRRIWLRWVECVWWGRVEWRWQYWRINWTIHIDWKEIDGIVESRRYSYRCRWCVRDVNQWSAELDPF